MLSIVADSVRCKHQLGHFKQKDEGSKESCRVHQETSLGNGKL